MDGYERFPFSFLKTKGLSSEVEKVQRLTRLDLGHFHESNKLSLKARYETSLQFFLSKGVYFFASSDLLIAAAAGACVSVGIIADGCKAPRTNEPLLAIDAANVVIEPLGVVAEDDDEEDETDDAVFTTALAKRNGTSSVK